MQTYPRAMKKQVNVDAIQSLKVRNLVRGMLSNGSPSEMRALLKKIVEVSSANDLKQTLEVLRSSPIFRSNGLSRYFQRKFSRPLVDLGYAESEIVDRINENKEKILAILVEVSKIMTCINTRRFDSALDLIRIMAEHEGVSLFLVRLIYIIKNRGSLPDLIRKVEGILDDIQVGNVRYLHLAIRELSV